jgi:hypothetical protein
VLEQLLDIDIGVDMLEVLGELVHLGAVAGGDQSLPLDLLLAVLLGELGLPGLARLILVLHQCFDRLI